MQDIYIREEEEEEDRAAVRLNYNFSAPARSDSTCTSGYGRLIILSKVNLLPVVKLKSLPV